MFCSPKTQLRPSPLAQAMRLCLLALLFVVPLTACGKGKEEKKDSKEKGELSKSQESSATAYPNSDKLGAAMDDTGQDQGRNQASSPEKEAKAAKGAKAEKEAKAAKAETATAQTTNPIDEETKETEEETTVAPLQPTSGQAQVNHQLIQVRGHIYVNMNYVAQGREGYAVNGTIKKHVGSLAHLNGDEQSTFGIGNPYQYLDRTHVVVKIDGRWMIFQDLAISSWQIPSCVAHMTGTIQGREENTVLFQLTQVPDSFASIFPEDPSKLKVIALSAQSFPTEALENPAFVGQTWEVWFDGDLQETDPSLPSPIHLGAVYQVRPVTQDD